MRMILLITRRELSSYFRTSLGFVTLAAILFLDGILFNVYALGAGEMKSSSVLTLFFYFSSGTTMIASIFISMRSLAEEHQTGSAPLILSAPVSETQIVLSKFLGAWFFLAAVTMCTLYMPCLIFVNGSVTGGQILAGYLGLLLLGAATTAIGIFGSASANNQLVAALLSASILTLLILFWWIGKAAEPPLSEVGAYLAFYQRHFPPFMGGVISSTSVVYYLTVTFFFLHAAVQTLEARRWR